jgi:hypothetical protein
MVGRVEAARVGSYAGVRIEKSFVVIGDNERFNTSTITTAQRRIAGDYAGD